MMEMTMPRRCARLMLALAFLAVAASAQASTIYNFSFTDMSIPDPVVVGKGSFTTNGASADPGYDLVESLTFDYVTTSAGTVYTGPFAMTLTVGAAYNPATGEFINHWAGLTYNDIGRLKYERPDFQLNVDGNSFGRGFIAGNLGGDIIISGATKSLAEGRLAITAAPPPAVPEPTSLLLLGTGLLTVAGTRRRCRTRRRAPAARISPLSDLCARHTSDGRGISARRAPRHLRRTCARLCHLAGGELEQIQLLVGWSSFLPPYPHGRPLGPAVS